MQNFDYQTPTRLIFGRGVVDEKLPRVMAQFGKRILLTYGGGSIKRSGLYDKVYALLPDAEITELPGIEPNPKYATSVVEGVRLCKEKHIDVILSVGGGSVLDCSKAIAAGAKYDGETWDLITRKVKTLAALPIVDIITLAATGSEYDCGGVISRTETHDKIGYLAPTNFPAVSFIDPTYTFTVPPMHTLAGVADCISHIMEQYFCADHIDMNDAFMEGAVRSLCKNVRVVLLNPEDYNARGDILRLHIGLQWYICSGEQRERMAVACHRTRAVGLLRHHARDRARHCCSAMDDVYTHPYHRRVAPTGG